MKPHDTFLELAAIAIDFPLSRLRPRTPRAAPRGLRGLCPLRAWPPGRRPRPRDLPGVTLPERRAAEILAAALQPHAVRHPYRLLVLAALLGLLLIGSLAVGAQLLRTPEEDLGIVLPVPSLTAVPDATPDPQASPVPSASFEPSAPPVSGPVVAPASLPRPSGAVSLAPAAAGGVWVLVNDHAGPALDGETGRAVLALLTRDGEPAPAGRCKEIQGVDAYTRAGHPAPPLPAAAAVAPDGSVRLLCRTVRASGSCSTKPCSRSSDAAGAASPGCGHAAGRPG